MNGLRVADDIPPFRPRLHRRIAFALSLAGLLAAAATSVASLYQIYRDETALVEQSLTDVEDSLIISLQDALWEVDTARTNLVLDSLMYIPGAGGLVLKTTDGDIYSRGNPRSPAWLERQYRLHFGADRQYPLGTLTIRIGTSRLSERLRARGIALAITVLVTIGAMSAAVRCVSR